jgi:predicted phosphohydrolase
MLHYPPTNEKFEESEFIKLIKEYKVEKVIYGHLHGPVLLGKLLNGYFEDVEYILTSADYLDFNPKRIF